MLETSSATGQPMYSISANSFSRVRPGCCLSQSWISSSSKGRLKGRCFCEAGECRGGSAACSCYLKWVAPTITMALPRISDELSFQSARGRHFVDGSLVFALGAKGCWGAPFCAGADFEVCANKLSVG